MTRANSPAEAEAGTTARTIEPLGRAPALRARTHQAGAVANWRWRGLLAHPSSLCSLVMMVRSTHLSDRRQRQQGARPTRRSPGTGLG